MSFLTYCVKKNVNKSHANVDHLFKQGKFIHQNYLLLTLT